MIKYPPPRLAGLTILAVALVALTLATPAMAHPDLDVGERNDGNLHECRIMAMWDAPSSSWGLPECTSRAKDGDAGNDKLCYCYSHANSAPDQAGHNFGPNDGSQVPLTPCWKDRSAHRSNRICSQR